jgi:hypothetical protein
MPRRLAGVGLRPDVQFEVEHVDGDRAVIRWRVTGAQDYRGVNLAISSLLQGGRHTGRTLSPRWAGLFCLAGEQGERLGLERPGVGQERDLDRQPVKVGRQPHR